MQSDNFSDSNIEEQNRVAPVPEALQEEIRLLLEYLIESKKKLSSYLLGESTDAQNPILENSRRAKQRGTDFPETKSISTGASMENAFLNFPGIENPMYSQTTFKCEESHIFCKNVAKKMSNLRRDVEEYNSRVNTALLNFLYQYLIVNYIELAEIDIFFSFCGSLIDPKNNKIHLTEGAFAKLFYDILLRLNFRIYTPNIYQCFEEALLFINCHLKNLEISSTGKFKTVQERRIIGLEAAIHVYVSCGNRQVKAKSRRLIFDLLRAEIDNGKQVDKMAFEDIIQPGKDIIEREYENLAGEPDRVDIIKETFVLIKDVINFIGGSNPQTAGTTLALPGFETISSGQSMIKVQIENNTAVTKNKTFEIDVSEYTTVKDLKSKVLQVLSVFSSSDIFLMTKGRLIYELDKTLKEVGIIHNQKVLVFQNEDFESEAESQMLAQKTSKVLQVIEILPDVSEDLASFALTKNGDDVPLTIANLAEGSIFLTEELKVIEKRKRELSKGNPYDAKHDKEIKALTNQLAKYEHLYDLIFKLMKMNNADLNDVLWAVLIALPLSDKAKQQVLSKTQSIEDLGSLSIAKENVEDESWKFDAQKLVSEPQSNKACYQLYVLCQIVKESNSNQVVEWLLFEGNLHIITTVFENQKIMGIMKEFSENAPQSYKKIKPVIRFMGSLMAMLKILNKFFLNTATLKTKLHFTESIVNAMYKELESAASASPKADQDEGMIIEAGISDYAEIYKQVIESTSFISQLSGMLESMIRNVSNFSIETDDVYFALLDNTFQFLVEIHGNWSEKTLNLLTSLANWLISDAGIYSRELLKNILYYYAVLGDHEKAILEHLSSMIQDKPGMDIEFTSDNHSADQSKSRRIIEILIVFVDLLDKKSKRKEALVPFLQSMCKKILKELEPLLLAEISSIQGVQNIDSKIPFTNDIILSMKSCVRVLESSGYELIEDLELEKFADNVLEKIFFEIFENEKGPTAALALHSESKLRNSIHEMLGIFCSKSTTRTIRILVKLKGLYKEEDFKSSQLNFVEVRKSDTFVGIKNLGSTCYANSLLQQLFHTKRIREFICNLPIATDTTSAKVLKELKLLFGQLTLGKMAQSDLLDFTKVFTRFEDQPINVKVQQDVNEFFNLLLDCIEYELKEIGAQTEDVFKTELGGEFLNEITSTEPQYDYAAANSEHYNTISLDVKNMTSMTEALDKFFKADLFEGDNKLFCEKYNKKIEAKKTCRLGEVLPSTMVIMLKRFEYDMATYTRYKLNDYFEFPMELNLARWVKKSDDDNLGAVVDSSNCNYRLKGVLVHSGTAEFGHYYSYILVNGKWMEFNDTKVTEFTLTEENIKKEWYGGDTTTGGMFPFSHNSRSAYMLFYEKITPGANLDSKTILSREILSPDVAAVIEEKNRQFTRIKSYSDNQTLRFLSEVLNKLDRNDGIDQLMDLLLNEERTVIKDQGFVDFLKHLKSIVLDKLASRTDLLKDLGDNNFGAGIKSIKINHVNENSIDDIVYIINGNMQTGNDSFDSNKAIQTNGVLNMGFDSMEKHKDDSLDSDALLKIGDDGFAYLKDKADTAQQKHFENILDFDN